MHGEAMVQCKITQTCSIINLRGVFPSLVTSSIFPSKVELWLVKQMTVSRAFHHMWSILHINFLQMVLNKMPSTYDSRLAVIELALGELLFESSDDQVIALKQCIKESFLLLLSSTQLVDSKSKETDFCVRTGREESKISNLDMIRSVALSQATSSIKESEDFKSRKRRNDEARDCTHG